MVTRALRDLRVAVMSVIANPNLRRLELGWIGSDAGEFMTLVVFSVFAFDHGGAGAVGVMALVRTLPTAIGAPFVAGLADRHPRVRVMLGADLSRALLLVLAAVLIATSAPGHSYSRSPGSSRLSPRHSGRLRRQSCRPSPIPQKS